MSWKIDWERLLCCQKNSFVYNKIIWAFGIMLKKLGSLMLAMNFKYIRCIRKWLINQ